MTPLRALSFVLLFVLAPASSAQARRPETHEVVVFKRQHVVSDPELAVFVVGDLAELGNDDVRRARKLTSADGEHWRVPIALPLDREYSYRYLVRSTVPADLSDPDNATTIGPLLEAHTSPFVNGPGTKTLQLHTTLVEPRLHWRHGDDEFEIERLLPLGPGRTLQEARVGVRSFATGHRNVEFFFESADGLSRDPEEGTYSTPLDQVFLQDGELYSYVPAPQVTAHRRDYSAGNPPSILSANLGRARTYRVMLPRGYDQHTWRRYPVLYIYDGQVVWDNGTGSWDRNGNTMGRLVDNGQVGEMVQVAVDFLGTDNCSQTRNRGRDCLSPEDTVRLPLNCGTVTGEADHFLLFLTEELKPLIDATYRTRPGREHTFATGYSFGGVFALYSGWEYDEFFGAIAAQSGSFWVPNFPARVRSEPRKEGRIYLDFGDGEVPDITATNARMRENLLGRDQGYALAGDFEFTVGFGQTHNHRAGGRRLGKLARFLWSSPREDASVPWPGGVLRPRSVVRRGLLHAIEGDLR